MADCSQYNFGKRKYEYEKMRPVRRIALECLVFSSQEILSFGNRGLDRFFRYQIATDSVNGLMVCSTNSRKKRKSPNRTKKNKTEAR